MPAKSFDDVRVTCSMKLVQETFHTEKQQWRGRINEQPSSYEYELVLEVPKSFEPRVSLVSREFLLEHLSVVPAKNSRLFSHAYRAKRLVWVSAEFVSRDMELTVDLEVVSGYEAPIPLILGKVPIDPHPARSCNTASFSQPPPLVSGSPPTNAFDVVITPRHANAPTCFRFHTSTSWREALEEFVQWIQFAHVNLDPDEPKELLRTFIRVFGAMKGNSFSRHLTQLRDELSVLYGPSFTPAFRRDIEAVISNWFGDVSLEMINIEPTGAARTDKTLSMQKAAEQVIKERIRVHLSYGEKTPEAKGRLAIYNKLLADIQNIDPEEL